MLGGRASARAERSVGRGAFLSNEEAHGPVARRALFVRPARSRTEQGREAADPLAHAFSPRVAAHARWVAARDPGARRDAVRDDLRWRHASRMLRQQRRTARRAFDARVSACPRRRALRTGQDRGARAAGRRRLVHGGAEARRSGAGRRAGRGRSRGPRGRRGRARAGHHSAARGARPPARAGRSARAALAQSRASGRGRFVALRLPESERRRAGRRSRAAQGRRRRAGVGRRGLARAPGLAERGG